MTAVYFSREKLNALVPPAGLEGAAELLNGLEYDRSSVCSAVVTALRPLLARLAPMFGLLGTLIPLGPGIIALGQGDTYTLSTSLLTAFDTTIAGLVAAAISTIRRGWYREYASILEAVSETLLELEKAGASV